MNSSLNLPFKRYGDLLITYLRPQWPRMLIMVVLLLASIGLQLINPQILRFFIDTATSGGGINPLLQAGLLFLGMAFVDQGLSIATAYFSTNVAWTATNGLRLDLLAHCLKLDRSFYQAHPPQIL